MVVASSPQISLPLYPEERRVYPVHAACPVYAESRSERTRTALRSRSLHRPDRGVKIQLQPRPALPAKSVHIPSSSHLCALCVSAFSSPNVDARDAESSISPLSATLTKSTRGWVSVPIVNPISQFNRRFISNSHRIKSFAYPHPLTPIESYSCNPQSVIRLGPFTRGGLSILKA